jgi:hypothetical protein
MSSWRKLFIVVLLALSLPVQSFAAISMKCVASQTEEGEVPVRQMEQTVKVRHHDLHEMALAGGEYAHHHDGDACHAHTCSTCDSCCSGPGLPVVPRAEASPATTLVAVAIPPSAGVVAFLTDGIERPPRYLTI